MREKRRTGGLKRKRGTGIAMATGKELPIDILIEILRRLPVRSLLRFRSVCSSWVDLIGTLKSSDYPEGNGIIAVNDYRRVFIEVGGGYSSPVPEMIPESVLSTEMKMIADVNGQNTRCEHYLAPIPCRGLNLIYSNAMLHVLHVPSRQILSLKLRQRKARRPLYIATSASLGYNIHNNHYQIVRMSWTRNSKNRCEVYTFGDSHWRAAWKKPPMYDISYSTQPVFAHGAHHWDLTRTCSPKWTWGILAVVIRGDSKSKSVDNIISYTQILLKELQSRNYFSFRMLAVSSDTNDSSKNGICFLGSLWGDQSQVELWNLDKYDVRSGDCHLSMVRRIHHDYWVGFSWYSSVVAMYMPMNGGNTTNDLHCRILCKCHMCRYKHESHAPWGLAWCSTSTKARRQLLSSVPRLHSTSDCLHGVHGVALYNNTLLGLDELNNEIARLFVKQKKIELAANKKEGEAQVAKQHSAL